MDLKKVFSYLTVLLIAALLLAACGQEEQTDSPAFPEAGTPLGGGTEVPPPIGPNEETPDGPEGVTPPAGQVDETPQATPGLDDTAMAPVTPEATTTEAFETPDAQTTGTPLAGGPPSSEGAIVLPDTGRAELTRLSELVGYQVIDLDGQALGTASDYLINLCEAHIIYILLDPDPALEMEAGRQVLIPYEIVSLHSGTLNSQDQTIQINVGLPDIQGAPTFDREALDLISGDWEAEVQGFWTNYGNLSLTSECRVPGATTGASGDTTGTMSITGGASADCTGADLHPRGQELANTYDVTYEQIMGWFCGYNLGLGEINWGYELSRDSDVPVEDIFALRNQGMGWGNIRNAVAEGNVPPAAPVQDRVTLRKNAFANNVLGASVVDGNGQPLGTVEEVMLEPESGRLTFYAVRLSADLQADQNLALVPPGGLNLESDGTTAELTLVLVVETDVLTSAPQAGELPDPGDTGLESQSLEYWGEFVPLTREELP